MDTPPCVADRDRPSFTEVLRRVCALRREKALIVTTVHGAKGLEFRALHLLGMDRIVKFPSQKRMSYTAVTRCKTSLRIYHKSGLPGYLEKGLAAIETAAVLTPSVDELFL